MNTVYTWTFICQVCLAVEVEKRPNDDLMVRNPYCDHCVIPMHRHYGSVTR